MEKQAKFRKNSARGSQVGLTRVAIERPILLVESQKSISRAVISIIQKVWAVEIDLAEDMASLEKYLSENKNYLVAIADLEFPDAPDDELLEKIQAHKHSIVAITQSHEQTPVGSLQKRGVIDYITKKNLQSLAYLAELIGRLHKNASNPILLVDDSTAIRELLGHSLKKFNFPVLMAKDGQEAIEKIEQHPEIELVVTDYNMPIMDGIEMTSKLRETYEKNKLAIIGISAADSSELGSRFLKHGANDFLVKPFSHDELLCRIQQNFELLEYINKIEDLANRDALTRMHNRRYFFENGTEIVDEAIEQKDKVVAAIMDIDHFKSVNDNYGHDCGDYVLIEFANLLQEDFNDQLCARIGGEEFCIVLKDYDVEAAKKRLDTFREAVAAKRFEWEDQVIPVTVSIGLDNQVDELEAMLKRADTKLYEAKAGGRNRVVG